MKKTLLTILCTVLVCSCVMGVTLAYIAQKTQTITNTFVIGNITLKLTETEADYKLIPGKVYSKDPTATIGANSEACYLFVKVEKTTDFDDYVIAEIDTTWEVVAAEEAYEVYCIKVSAEDAKTGKSYPILKDSKVTVDPDVTKKQIDDLGTNSPEIKFTAYAIQAEGFGTAAAAWAEAKNLDNTTT